MELGYLVVAILGFAAGHLLHLTMKDKNLLFWFQFVGAIAALAFLVEFNTLSDFATMKGKAQARMDLIDEINANYTCTLKNESYIIAYNFCNPRPVHPWYENRTELCEGVRNMCLKGEAEGINWTLIG